jgi:hypothetical protein
MKAAPPACEGAAFDPRKRHLRPEEAAPSRAGSAAFVKHPYKVLFIPISPISVNSLNLLTKFTEFTE